MKERVLIPLPCGHLVDNNEKKVFVVRCESCDRTWQASRVHGVIEVREMA